MPRGAIIGALSVLLVLQTGEARTASAADFPKAQTSPVSGDTRLPLPGYMETIQDLNYGPTITRITGDPGTPIPGPVPGDWQSLYQANYPSEAAWSADGSLIYLIRHGGMFFDGNTYEPLDLPDVPPGYPQWSPNESDIMWVVNSEGIRKWNVRTGTTLSLWRYPGYTSYSTMVRTSPSHDGTKLGVKAVRESDGNHVCLGINLVTGRIEQEISFDDWGFERGSVTEVKARRCSATPSGRYLFLNGYANGAYNDQGHFFDWQTGVLVHQQRPNNGENTPSGSECPGGHGDLALDAKGDDLFVGPCKAGGLSWSRPFAGKQVALRVSDGAMWAVGPSTSHTSCRLPSRPGWCTGSDTSGSARETGYRLDGGRVEYYASLQGDGFSEVSYYERPYDNPSPDGRKILFTTHWNNELDGAAAFILDLGPLAGSSHGDD